MKSSAIRTRSIRCEGGCAGGEPVPAPFEMRAYRRDRWHDSAERAAVFREELACLQLVRPERRGRWIEVGVGTGRFASALGTAEGADPSPKMLEYAAGRGVRTHLGTAGDLPIPDGTFDGVLMALTLCFVEDAEQALRESFRIPGRRSCSILTNCPPSPRHANGSRR